MYEADEPSVGVIILAEPSVRRTASLCPRELGTSIRTGDLHAGLEARMTAASRGQMCIH